MSEDSIHTLKTFRALQVAPQTQRISLNQHEIKKSNTSAGYASLNYKYNKYWNVDAGLRFENADFNYEQNGIIIPTQSKTYNDWLPSLGLNYSNNGLAMGITYNTNISRPSYSMLNNNYFYISHTSWETGNPLLQSSKDHNIDLRFSYNHTYVTVLRIHVEKEISARHTHTLKVRM